MFDVITRPVTKIVVTLHVIITNLCSTKYCFLPSQRKL